ncbi:hypothetical protein OIE66_05810 [Nonomuraea sp. NBC_01738]|uniref:hypothetical protein n=1 Tax=Nonomuraea sp. NBC_01738 TaxID=2976003 RepID=UPI002E0F3D97|nr:hypothetical protein OIE66_05810 [Nonomuraea sp. NBC_01738]
MTPPRRRLAIAVATLAIAGFTTTACGNTIDCATLSGDLNKITTEFSSAVAASGSDLSGIEKASAEAGAKVKELAGKYDGDIASGLNDLGTAFAGIKVDPKNPTSSMDSLSKIQDFQTKIVKACS